MRYLAFALAVLAGCSGDLPNVEEVRDFRILALRADPPEIFVDVDDGVQVQFSALVVDPRESALSAAPVDFTWSLCPIESDDACLDYDKRYAEASTADRQTLDDLSAISSSGSAVQEPQAEALDEDQTAARAMWPYAITPYQLTLGQSETLALATYFLNYNSLGYGMGSLPSIILDLEAHDDAIRSEKRFTLALQDIKAAAETFGVDLGYTVCESEEDQNDGCVPLRRQDRNSNPTFDRIQYASGDLAGQSFTDVPTPFSMHLGASIRILPVMTGDSYEVYQELYTDAATGQFQVRDQVEVISISWFSSAGELQDALTTPTQTKTLDTVFEATDSIPSEGALVSVYMVARDQRGGIAWQNFEINVTP